MNKPHKHAKVIKAWADGKRVQISLDEDFGWVDCENPAWHPERSYRVKPEVVRFRVYIRNSIAFSGDVVEIAQPGDEADTRPSFVRWIGDWQEVEVSND